MITNEAAAWSMVEDYIKQHRVIQHFPTREKLMFYPTYVEVHGLCLLLRLMYEDRLLARRTHDDMMVHLRNEFGHLENETGYFWPHNDWSTRLKAVQHMREVTRAYAAH